MLNFLVIILKFLVIFDKFLFVFIIRFRINIYEENR